MAINSAAGKLVAAVAETPSHAGTPGHRPQPAPLEAAEPTASAFVPRVSGPGEPLRNTAPAASSTTGGQTTLDQETADAAFVF
jgi:hypothetical protein